VEKHYARLFEDAPKLDDASGNLVFTGVADDPDTLATLRGLGFQHPERATETIRGWHFGRRAAVQSARAREVLTELVPGLISAFAGSGDPDAALAGFDAALTRMPGAVELLSILRSNQPLRELFGDLMGGAPRLAEVVAARPHVLDAVIDPARLAALADTLDDARQTLRMQGYLAPAADFEDALNRARDFAAEEKFLIGVRMLSGALDPDMGARAYSALAAASVATLLQRVEAEFRREHGEVAGGRVAVMAMGKLGSREMTATSDLDLIVIYDFPADVADSVGRRPLSPGLYYARLTQRLVGALTAPTKAGRLYEVDLRLRPSGRKGPLATSLAAFELYQREEAETWEHMALTRARAIAGDASLSTEVEAAVDRALTKPREPKKLAREIAGMRGLIAREKGDGDAFDLKLAPGGLIDIEFLAQYLILAHAATTPSVLCAGVREALLAATAAGWLAPADGEMLCEAHRLMTAVAQVLRLTLPDDAAPAAAAVGVKRRIAAAAGAPDFEHLTASLTETRRRVRAAFRRIVGAVAL
jgi:glutamate-ammonia-ligase adenylyltransferase